MELAFKSTKRSDTVAWRSFLDAVDNAAILSKQEPEDSGVDLGELYGIIDKIKEIVENRRLNLKPYFQVRERERENYIILLLVFRLSNITQ